MRGLKSLIRLHRWQLDEQRRKLAELETLAADLQAQIHQIAVNLESEAEFAGQSADGARAYSAYMAAEMARRDRLEESLAELERELEESRNDVADAFRRVKTFEISMRNRERQRDLRARRRGQAEQDNLGLDIHRRNSTR